MPTSRKELFESIKVDYPNIPDDFLNTFLDVYEKDKDYIEYKIRQEKKKHKRIPEPRSQMTLEEIEKLHEKFKDVPQGKAWVEADETKIYSEDNTNVVSTEIPSDGEDALPKD